MDALFRILYQSPIGLIEIGGTDTAVTSVRFVSGRPPQPSSESTPVLRDAFRQIDEYFLGRRTTFRVALDLRGTPFQQSVWRALLDVPFGRNTTYRDIAAAIGRPRAVRAVGAANGANPVSIIVPCHRVIGADGSLVGYGGGLRRKAWLLAHEQSKSGPLFA